MYKEMLIARSRLPLKRAEAGTITPALLIIAGAFTIVIYGLLFVLGNQLDYSSRQVAGESSLDIAEAGINYYRWHLAHDPTDFTDATGGPGPYEHEYLDPQGKALGKYRLEVTAPTLGSTIVTIRSTGWTYQYSAVKRVVAVQYGKPSFAQYSFLSNASSWYGVGITVNGKVHSNNGIRMDGTNTSLVTSANETYTCGSETGCSPPQQKPGVWGSGGDAGLWQFPVPTVDFDAISFDFTNMKNEAVSNGLHLEPSQAQGYHLVFANDGTVRVYQVTSTNYYNYYDAGTCQRLYQRIASETLMGTYNVSATPIIFAEDYLWVEGVVKGRTTVVAARFPIDSSNMNIWIRSNLTYAAYDNTNSLGLIAQNDIYFARDIPNDFKIDAALMAQKGKIIRHRYSSYCSGTSGAVKNSLTINGTVISFLKSYWNYGSPPSSGFVTRQITYDSNLLYAPPPYFPTSGEYEFISWIEE